MSQRLRRNGDKTKHILVLCFIDRIFCSTEGKQNILSCLMAGIHAGRFFYSGMDAAMFIRQKVEAQRRRALRRR